MHQPAPIQPPLPDRVVWILVGSAAVALLCVAVGLYQSAPPTPIDPAPAEAAPGQQDTSEPAPDAPRPVSGEEVS